MVCCYCGSERTNPEGWHGCVGAFEAKAKIDAAIKSIRRNQTRPGSDPITSEGLRHRANRRRDTIVAAKIAGTKIRPEYSQIDRTEEI